jgi:hypothetical protein
MAAFLEDVSILQKMSVGRTKRIGSPHAARRLITPVLDEDWEGVG